MKRFLIACLALTSLIFTLPVLAVRPWAEDIPVDVPRTSENIDASTEITLYHNGEVLTLPLNEYLAGVIAAEIPATFPVEAMKAQAVAARTYTVNRAGLEKSTEHNGAMVCSNPAHCKGYTPISEISSSWGKNSDNYLNKINAAISQTDGEIMLYENQPISAVFFAFSAGKTERAADVWGTDVPYLQSVDSSSDKALDGAVEVKDFPAQEFKSKFTEKYPSAVFSDDPSTWFSNITRSDAGGVMTLTVGGVAIKGTQLRSLFSLRSTNFSVTCTSDKISFETRGYGHGVGLSQYGAKALAEDGKTYREILSQYYKNINFGKISK